MDYDLKVASGIPSPRNL